MSLNKSAKRRAQRKNKASRIREISTPKPLSIQEIQDKIAQTKDAVLIKHFNSLAPSNVV